MRKSVTFRLDPDLLERARHCAEAENRSLTNFIETALRRIVDGGQAPVQGESPSEPIHSSQRTSA